MAGRAELVRLHVARCLFLWTLHRKLCYAPPLDTAKESAGVRPGTELQELWIQRNRKCCRER